MSREWSELRRPLRVAMYGFWPGFDLMTSPIFGLLASVVPVEIIPMSTGPDVTICSVFGGHRPPVLNDSLTFQYIGEPDHLVPKSMQWGDYRLGFLPDSSDTFWLPHWQHDLLKYNHGQLTFEDKLRPRVEKTDFCVLYASHDRFNTRGPLVDALNRHQLVHCYGLFRNNRPYDHSRDDEVNRSNRKLAVLDRYRYSLAVENCCQPYYVTEKLSESILANTVPIYWGDPLLAESPFNLKRILNVTGLSPDQAYQEVVKLEQDQPRYEEMLAEPMWSRPVFPQGLAARSDRLLRRILEDHA